MAIDEVDTEIGNTLNYLLKAIHIEAEEDELEKQGFQHAPKQMSNIKWSGVVHLDSLRRQGNRYFTNSNYIAAMNLYSQCIVQSGEAMERMDNWSYSEEEKLLKAAKVRKVLFLAVSNRAETWLRLNDYRRALRDADRALESEPSHAKCLVRRGKSLDGLQRYEEAVFCFTAALQLFPDDVLIRNSLRSSKICHLQSRDGDFNFDDCDGGALEPCCEFVGPVEIQHVSDGGRGVFLTKSATAGELLLVSNPLAVLGGDPGERQPIQSMEDYWIARAGTPLSPTEDDLALHLSFGAGGNAELRAKLDCLFSGGSKQTDIPDMSLFKPGAEWSFRVHPPLMAGLESVVAAHKELVSRLRKVVEFNAFTDFDDWGRTYSGRAGRAEYLKAGCGGLWLLPSFLNHSCQPNCTKVYIGDSVFVRATRTLEAGEELSLAYCDVSLGVHSRRDRLRKWGFECQCRRCLSEMAHLIIG